MIRFLILALCMLAGANSQAQANGGSMAAKEPASANVKARPRKECIFKPIWSNGAKTRDDRQIGCVFDQHKGEIYAVYRQALLKDPKLAGKLEFSFQIDAGGRVQNAKIARSSFNNPDFENKLLQKLATFQWPAIAGVSWSGSHPFTFVSIK